MMDKQKKKIAQAMKAKRKPASEEEREKIKEMLDEDYVHEEDPMGQTVVQGQQSKEWKEKNPFQAAQEEAAMERAAALARKNLQKRFNKGS